MAPKNINLQVGVQWCIALLGDHPHHQSEINDTSSQKLVALGTVWQRQGKEGTLCVALRELKLADVRVDSHVTKRTSQDHEVHHHGAAGLTLNNELVGNEAVTGEVGILLVVIEPCFYHPLVAQSRESTRLVEQLVDELVCAVWLQLQVIESDLLK